MRIRNAIACAAALTVGMPLAATAAGPGGTTHQAAHPSPKVKTCKGKQLNVTVRNSDAAAGTAYLKIRIRNKGKRCAVRAWPQIGYASKRGRPVGFLASHPREHYRARVLRHGQVRRVVLATSHWQNYGRRVCWPRQAARLAVYIPSRITPAARHLKKVPGGARKVCTSRRGRPRVQ